MRTVVKDEKLGWREVKRKALAPIMFLVHANDMTKGVSSYVNLFAHDAKSLRKIENHKDCEELQNYINKKYEWKLM